MRRTDDVSRLEQLTTYGKRHLRDEADVRTVGELGQFLKRTDADEVLDRCASLAGCAAIGRRRRRRPVFRIAATARLVLTRPAARRKRRSLPDASARTAWPGGVPCRRS